MNTPEIEFKSCSKDALLLYNDYVSGEIEGVYGNNLHLEFSLNEELIVSNNKLYPANKTIITSDVLTKENTNSYKIEYIPNSMSLYLDDSTPEFEKENNKKKVKERINNIDIALNEANQLKLIFTTGCGNIKRDPKHFQSSLILNKKCSFQFVHDRTEKNLRREYFLENKIQENESIWQHARKKYMTIVAFRYALKLVIRYIAYLEDSITNIKNNNHYIKQDNILFNDRAPEDFIEHKKKYTINKVEYNEYWSIKDSTITEYFIRRENNDLYLCDRIVIVYNKKDTNCKKIWNIFWDSSLSKKIEDPKLVNNNNNVFDDTYNSNA
jgi:hypothetical protein